MSIYDTLNKEQREAVFHTEGPVLILAGAGSGKTRVITHRVAYLMQECEVSPWNILAITFTNKAAGEMRERVDKLIGFGAQSVWISTFHSMCVRILRRHIDLLGYKNSFTIYDTDDQKTLMKDIFKQLRVDKDDLKEREALSYISKAKNNLLTPGDFREAETGFGRERIHRLVAECYAQYQRALKNNNALDFDDLLMKTVELFKEHPEVLQNYQERFRYIMVDEYQDTNNAQFELVRLLADRYRNLCVVGDDDQSIYRFRGANIRNILDFEKNYPDAMVVRLEQNYRSTQNILDAANAVISHNQGRKVKKLWTDRGKGNPLHLRVLLGAPDEGKFIVGDILRKREENPALNYRDFAVLYRTNAQSRLIEEALVGRNIPYNVVGGTNFYDRREVRDILGYLHTLANAADDLAVRRILNVPRRGIGQTTEGRVIDFAMDNSLSFFEALEECDRIGSISRGRKKLIEFVDLIHSLRDFSLTHTIPELIDEIVRRTDYEEYLRNLDPENGNDRINNVQELKNTAAQYAEDPNLEDAPTLLGFLERIALVAAVDQVEEDVDRVLLMTLHSAKGLEFPQVYLAGMEENIFPSFMALMADEMEGTSENIEEERRLCYVGITRAQDDLTLTLCQSRFVRGEFVESEPSRFIGEIPEELFDEESDDDPMELSMSVREDDLPFADVDGGSGGRRGFSAGASGRGASSRRGAGRAREAWSGPQGDAIPSLDSERSSGKGSGKRPKASFKKPHTDEKKLPFAAKKGLDALQKGMPGVEKLEYTVGDRVSHVKYGEGTVTALEKKPRDYKVTVSFDEYGQKIMYAGFAKLQKL